MVTNKTYEIKKELLTNLERLWFELNSRKSIISEIIQTNPSFDISSSKIFEEYQQISKNYRTETNRLIKDITENKYNDSANWTISFDDHTLTIVTNED